MVNHVIRPTETGNCPHCGVLVRFETAGVNDNERVMGSGVTMRARTTLVVQAFRGLSGRCQLMLVLAACPNCNGVIVSFSTGGLLWPDSGVRRVPEEVEEQAPELATDFREAALVLLKSPKASAALSRRCLQMLLVKKGKAAPKAMLSSQVDEVLKNGDLPVELAKNLDAIRELGNFAAHAIDTAAGQIVEVEPKQAEWLLRILEQLFDHYYVRPAKDAVLREELNETLIESSRKPLKEPPA